MTELSENGKAAVEEIAHRHGMSPQAVSHMLKAVWAGNGRQAQFNHPEFGGMGQWSLGGMTMIGDMFNNGLKARVDGLCSELSGLVQDQSLFATPSSSQSQSQGHGSTSGTESSLFVQSSDGWPYELGQAASVGTQNDLRYAYFPAKRRLAIDKGGQITVYDTADHQISGFGQAQGGGQSLNFTSQHGQVKVSELRVVPQGGEKGEASSEDASMSAPPRREEEGAGDVTHEDIASKSSAQTTSTAMSDDQIFSCIEKLADLLDRGIVSQSEFDAKKAELLARL